MLAGSPRRFAMAMLLGAVGASAAYAQDVAPVEAPAEAPALPATDAAPAESALPAAAPAAFLPSGTVIEILVDQAVSSKTNKTGDWFDIELAQPIMLNGVELVPAGTRGRGQVVHAAKSGWGGKPGELILAARYLETPNGQIPLRAMKLGAMGKNNNNVAFAASMAFTPLPFVISGTSAVVQSGFQATAKLNIDLYPQGSAPVAAAAEPATPNPETDIQQTEGQ